MIKCITLKTAQTIMGDIGEHGSLVKIKKPVQVIVQPGQDGQPMMGFAPFLQFTDEFESGITINFSDILCTTTPVRELENQYNKMFGVGIEIVSSMPK
jgi:hypothetical protein